MKKIGLIKLTGILFLAFGITDLNFDDLAVEQNYKAYAAILVGLIISIVSFLLPDRLKD